MDLITMKRNEGDLKMHQCPFCVKHFPSASKLLRHTLVHTGQKPFKCLACGKAFNQPEHLKTHTLKIHQSSSSTNSLKNSILPNDEGPVPTNYNADNNDSISQDTSVYAPLPSALPSITSSLTEPKMEMEIEMSPFDIDPPPLENKDQQQCIPHFNDGFMVNNNPSTSFVPPVGPALQDDVGSATVNNVVCYTPPSVYTPPTVYTCKVCLKSFSTSLQLQIHTPVHQKQSVFQCGVCGKAFQKKGHLIIHLKSHQWQRFNKVKTVASHQCPCCIKSFCSPSKLQRHFLIHTGQKPFSCTLCGKSFRQETHLTTHLRGAHRIYGQGGLRPNQAPVQMEERNGWSGHTSDPASMPESQSSVLQHPPCQENGANSSVELELQCEIRVHTPQDLANAAIKSEASEKNESDNGQSSISKPVVSDTPSSSVGSERRCATARDSKPFKCKICHRSFHLAVNLMRHQAYHKEQEGLQNQSAQSSTKTTLSQTVFTESHTDSTPIKTSPEPRLTDSLDLNIIVKSEAWSESHSSVARDPPSQRTVMSKPADQLSVSSQATAQPNRTESRSYQCHTCNQVFPSLSVLQRHTMVHTEQGPFDCLTCGKSFRQKTHLTVHSRTHLWSRYHKQRSMYVSRPPSRTGGITRLTSDAPLRQMFIRNQNRKPSGFDLPPGRQLGPANPLPSMWNNSNTGLQSLSSSANSYNQLSSNVTVGNVSHQQHMCLLCFKSFPSASKLLTHEMVHTGLKPFQCLTCGKTFRQLSHLKTHEIIHNRSEPQRPPITQQNVNMKIRSQQQPLYPRISVGVPSQKRSMPINSVHPKYTPAVSNQRQFEHFSGNEKSTPPKVSDLTKSWLKNNKSPWVKENAHMCQICLKSFATPSKLSRHLLIHSGMRPFKCSLCSKTFTQLTHLKVHERSRLHESRASGLETQDKVIGGSLVQGDDLNHNHARENVITDNAIENEEQVGGQQPQLPQANAAHYFKNDEAITIDSDATEMRDEAISEIDIVSDATHGQGVTKLEGGIISDVTHSQCVTRSEGGISLDVTRSQGVTKSEMDIVSDASHGQGATRTEMAIDSDVTDSRGLTMSEVSIDLNPAIIQGLALTEMAMQSNAIDTEEIAIPEIGISSEATDSEMSDLGLLDDNIETEAKHNYVNNPTNDPLEQTSFASDLASEIQRLVESQVDATLLTQEMKDSLRCGLEIPFKVNGATANSDGHTVTDRLASSTVGNPSTSGMADHYWCGPLNMLQCDKCTRSFQTRNELQCHKCIPGSQSSMVPSVQKNQCDICFKNFVSPSKLRRHYIIHTGLRPFQCDTCGKAFTQITHLKTHKRIHGL